MRRQPWLLLLAPPVLAWLTLAVLTLTHTPRQVHTGDALLDTFAQAMVEHGWLLKQSRIDGPWLPEDEWRELEQRFGDDPRFWWLCYKLRSTGAEELYPDSYVFLHEARHRGIANLPILLALYDENTKTVQHAINNDRRIPPLPNYPAPPRDMSTYLHGMRKVVDSSYTDQGDEILEELKAVAPSHPIVYYLQALLAGERLDYELSLLLLKQGNVFASNSHNTYLLIEQMSIQVSLPSASYSDQLCEPALRNFTNNGSEIIAAQTQWDAEALAYDALRMHRLDIVDEIHKMGCYIGIVSGYRWGPAKLGLQACLHVQNETAQQTAMTADVLKATALSKLHKVLYTTYRYMLSEGANSPQATPRQAQLRSLRASIYQRLDDCLDAASGGYYSAANWLRGIYPDAYLFPRRAPDYMERMDEKYARLLSFDYTTCSFTQVPAATR